MVKVALAKGRLAEKAMAILEKAGVDCSCVDQSSRKLVFTSDDGKWQFILVKPTDVPTYVYHGITDIGVVGKDTLLEENLPMYEMADLGFGKCRLCIAGKVEDMGKPVRVVATKYPNIAKRFYYSRGENVEIVKLSGSVELGPLVGLSDVILDIVESGGTLRANGMDVFEEVCQVSARLVVNQVSLKTKSDEIKTLVNNVQSVLKEGNPK